MCSLFKLKFKLDKLTLLIHRFAPGRTPLLNIMRENRWVECLLLSWLLCFFLGASIKNECVTTERKVDWALAIRVTPVSSRYQRQINTFIQTYRSRRRRIEPFCFWFCCCSCREETQPRSVAPEAPKETTVRPRKRKADVAIVSSLKGVQISPQVASTYFFSSVAC